MSDRDVEYAAAGFAQLTPQPDAVAAVRAARQADFRVVTLSNGSTASTQGFLERAGLADDVELVVSIDDARAWKPAPAPYLLAAERAGVEPARMALVAVHSWDIHGASRAGYTTGWCPRLEGRATAAFEPATVTAAGLDGVIAELAGLPSG